MIKLNYSSALPFTSEAEIKDWEEKAISALQSLHQKSCPGSDFLGWLDLPNTYDKEEVEQIKTAASKIREDSDVLVVIGIGGSYMGSKAVIEALRPNFYNSQSAEKRRAPEIYYVGNNLSPNYINDLLTLLENKDISLNVISKSGTTLEPAIAFRIFKEFMEKKYGEEAKNRIYVTTDKEKGALKRIADEKDYQTFIIPSNIQGRYSVLTPVGLLPIAVSGIEIEELLKGAAEGFQEFKTEDRSNPPLLYAALRNIFYQKGKPVEIMVNYEPQLHSFAEWWKQIFGESEGKDGKGIFPASLDFTTDLHSLGQYVQDGSRNVFETVLHFKNTDSDITVQNDEKNLDGLNYLSGKTISHINASALEATVAAHVDGGVPNIVFEIDRLDALHLGKLIYLFELACGISALILGVNPFDQPGVEAYKNNLFKLLGKPI